MTRTRFRVNSHSFSCFSMVVESKFKIYLYHENFPETLEKYNRFPKFTLLFSIIYVHVNGKAVCG